MHTSARQHADLHLELSGVLTADAQVRSRLSSDGLHTVPVLRLELEHGHGAQDNNIKHIVIERPYTELQRPEAEAQAKLLLRGRCITFASALTDVRLVFPNVSQINII